MIVTRLDTRPATAQTRQPQPSHCMTIIDKFNEQPTAIHHHRKSSAMLPTFAEMPSKDFTQLFLSKFKVKGLPVECGRSPSKRHGSQKKLTTTWRHQPVDVREVLRMPREEQSLATEFQSFFRDGNTSRKNRPVTAKKTVQAAGQSPSRPMTAIRQREPSIKKDRLLSAQKQTRVTASLSNSIFLHERSARTIYEKLTKVVQQSNFTANIADLPKKRITKEMRTKNNSPIKALQESLNRQTEMLVLEYPECPQKSKEVQKPESDTIDLQELLSKTTAKNNQHLHYLQDQQFDQYSKFLKAEAQAHHGAVVDGDRELKQYNNTVTKDDSEKLDFYLELTNKIEGVQDRLDRVMQAKTMVRDSRQAEPSSQLLNLDEYEQVVRLFEMEVKEVEALDKLLVKLQPLRILSKERRLQILSLAELWIVEPEDTVIQKQSKVEFVFIVVKGSLEKSEAQLICGLRFNLTKSIFDGDTFGFDDRESDRGQHLYDYQVISKQRSTLLRIPYHQYMSIQSEFLKSELSVKVQALQELECFKEMPAKDLIPLATLLTDKRFSNGDIILKEGTPADKFYLMIKGSASIVKEEVVVRKKPQKQRSFANQPFSHCNSTNSIHRPASYKKTNRFIGKYSGDDRNQHKYRLVAEDDKKIAYYYYHEFKDVRKGEQLVYRAVAAGLDSQAPPKSTGHDEPLLKLSVIANSSDCQLFVLASQDIRKMPEYLLKPFLKYCEEHNDYDLFFDERQNMKLKQWQQYKSQLCQEVIEQKIRTRKDGWMR